MATEQGTHGRRRRATPALAGGATLVAAAVAGVMVVGFPAHAEDDNKSAGPTRAEFARLQGEVREQRQLIIQMLQNEQQRYEMLLRLIQGQNAQGGGVASPLLPGAAPVAGADPGASGDEVRGAIDKEERAPRAGADSRADRKDKDKEAPARERRTGFVEGKVTLPGGSTGDVYVYVEGIRTSGGHGKSIEIRQEGKQFHPRVAVVQAGTSVMFPNLDKIYHNVFSNSPRNAFDLGSHSADEKPRAVTLTTPGVVEVFCNMHQKMSANILVVPNALYTKVRPDGSFRLENVPVGERSLTVWSPAAKPTRRRVDVAAGGAQVSFVLERDEPKAHANKMGQAYGSYRE